MVDLAVDLIRTLAADVDCGAAAAEIAAFFREVRMRTASQQVRKAAQKPSRVLAGAYLRLLPSWVSAAAARRFRDRGEAIVVNVHPWEIDPDQPLVGPGRFQTWTHYARLERTEHILRVVLATARFRDVATRLREIGLLDAAVEREAVR